ncbi:hypothetical protein ET445_03090 [Agromyces protaetiae]|uniref:Uncharacterized protein n=1 Tax=Agromyces protaetiae TaxID=2509455 RepID=A0A4P6FA28_9MICO|nr:hypothetical protein [Agromyces protaetiae]QAY72475.1 hypothetical protein ET445_03090 [Agromyces protaetiae]
MADLFEDLGIVDGPVPVAVLVIAGLVFVYLLGRERTWHWVFTAIVVLVVGALVGVGGLWLAIRFFGAIEEPVPDAAWGWAGASAAGILLALFNLWRSRWWRKLIAVAALPLFAIVGWLEIAADTAQR